MSDEKPPFGGRPPRPDLNDTFPARLAEPTGPALLGEMDGIAPLLVSARLLQLVARRGGSRVRISEIEHAIGHLERAVPPEVRAHCSDEARRVARWIEDPPPAADSAQAAEPGGETPRDDTEILRDGDVRSRLAVARWALEHELDLEIEWYDEDRDVWPRDRVTPVEVCDDAGEETVTVQTNGDQYDISVIQVRWLMPVERLTSDEPDSPPGATVLAFPRRPEEED